MPGAPDARLADIFPGDPPSEPHPWLRPELEPDERVVWQGRPNRWGFLTATPFVVVLVAALGLVYFTLGGPGVGVGGAFGRLLSGDAPLWLPALLLAGLAVVAWLVLRDPRPRWLYAVTDRRMMTFYRGSKLREVRPDGLHALRVVQSPEMRMRRLGDVVWKDPDEPAPEDPGTPTARTGRRGRRASDRSRWGFRGMADPERWRERMMEWRRVVLLRRVEGEEGEGEQEDEG